MITNWASFVKGEDMVRLPGTTGGDGGDAGPVLHVPYVVTSMNPLDCCVVFRSSAAPGAAGLSCLLMTRRAGAADLQAAMPLGEALSEGMFPTTN